MSSLEPYRPLSSYGEESPHPDELRRDELPRRWPTLAEHGHEVSQAMPARLHLRVGPVDVAFDGEAKLVRGDVHGEAYALVSLPGRASFRLPGEDAPSAYPALPHAEPPHYEPLHAEHAHAERSRRDSHDYDAARYTAQPSGAPSFPARPSAPVPPTAPPSIPRNHLRGQGARRPSWQGETPPLPARPARASRPSTSYPPQPVPSAPAYAPVYAPSGERSARPAPPQQPLARPSTPPPEPPRAIPPPPVEKKAVGEVVQREVVREEPPREVVVERPRSGRRWWEWLILMVLLALLLLAVWIWRYGTVESITGQVQAEVIEATTPEDGVIGEVFVDEGDRVVDGTQLFTLTDPEEDAALQKLRQQVTVHQRLVEEAEAQLRTVRSSQGTRPDGVLEREVEMRTAFEQAGRQKKTAEDDYEATRQRHAAGEASQADLQRAEAALREARAELQRTATIYGEARDAATRWQMIRAAELDPDRTSSEQRVLRDRQADLSRAKARYDAVAEDQDERIVVARATGTVYDVIAGPGQAVAAGEPVLILRGDRAPWAHAEFALRDAQRIERTDPMWIDLPEMLEHREATLVQGVGALPAVQSADGSDRVPLRFGFAEPYPDAQPGTRAEVEVRVGLYAWLTHRGREFRAWWHRRVEAARG